MEVLKSVLDMGLEFSISANNDEVLGKDFLSIISRVLLLIPEKNLRLVTFCNSLKDTLQFFQSFH